MSIWYQIILSVIGIGLLPLFGLLSVRWSRNAATAQAVIFALLWVAALQGAWLLVPA